MAATIFICTAVSMSQASAYPSFVTLSKQAPNRQAIPAGHGRRGL